MSAVTLLLLVVASAALFVQAASEAHPVGEINPIMRYRMQSHLKDRLLVLKEKTAADEGKRNARYRNCYLSPMQCSLMPLAELDRQDALLARFLSTRK